jgi:hypothetical protein
MKKYFFIVIMFTLALILAPKFAFAAGITASGGGTKTVGQTFTVTVTASGASFNTIQGKISVSGPVSIVSFNAGAADVWMAKPANGTSFAGAFLGRTVNSTTVATIQLRGTAVGSGAVSISNVALINAGSIVGSGASSASFTIQKAPDLPGSVSVSSSTHSDQNVAYEATTVTLAWNKASNVTGFAYLLDSDAGTTPPSTVTSADTTVTYDNKAIGTYYFHIKGKSADGWGSVTHFKITIKEPDPKVNEALSKPTMIKIEKTDQTDNNIVDGTFSGFTITGQTEPGFVVNLKLDPTPTLPEGKALSVKADTTGQFKLLIDYPIHVGHYKLTIQGQNEKILTPESEPIYFEISQVKGGQLNILTLDDEHAPVVAKAQEAVKKWYQKINYQIASLVLGILSLLLILTILFLPKITKRKLY